MMISKIKNGIIIILVILALFQTGWLWFFVSITDRNFFAPYLSSIVSPAVMDGHSDFVRPYRIVSGMGDGRFAVHYSGLDGSDAENYVNNVLARLLENGEYIGAQEADYPVLLAQPAFIYDYAFPMDAQIFTRAFRQNAGILTNHNVQAFSRILIQLPNGESEDVRVFFLNDSNAAEYALETPAAEAEALIQEIPAMEENAGLFYTAQKTEEGLEFIAGGDEGRLSWAPVIFTNPYVNTYGEELISFVQTRIESFFSNPVAVNAAPGADGVYTFSSVNTVVRYYERDVLEYTSYQTVDRSQAVNLMVDYAAARAFIGRDTLVVNESYLADYRMEDGQHVFYFNYVINDMPLIMQENWPSSEENGCPIEVVVDHGQVVRYKKLVYNFHIDESESQMVAVNFEEAALNTKIDRVILGYLIEYKPRLSLYWLFENAEGRRFVGLSR